MTSYTYLSILLVFNNPTQDKHCPCGRITIQHGKKNWKKFSHHISIPEYGFYQTLRQKSPVVNEKIRVSVPNLLQIKMNLKINAENQR